MHDSIKETTLKNFKYAKFNNDEEFNSYLEDIEVSVKSANQAIDDSGLGATKPIFGIANSRTGISSSVTKYINKKSKVGELPGKEI